MQDSLLIKNGNFIIFNYKEIFCICSKTQRYTPFPTSPTVPCFPLSAENSRFFFFVSFSGHVEFPPLMSGEPLVFSPPNEPTWRHVVVHRLDSPMTCSWCDPSYQNSSLVGHLLMNFFLVPTTSSWYIRFNQKLCTSRSC